MDEPKDGSLVFLGEISDELKLLPESALFGVDLLADGLGGLDAEELVGGDAEGFGEGDERRGRWEAVVILVVGDGALGEGGGLGELDLGEALGPAQGDEALPEAGLFDLLPRHGEDDCRGGFHGAREVL